MRRPERSWTEIKQLARGAIAAGSLLLSGCYSTGEGLSPPIDRIYFPVGLALANAGSHLVVLNSDFDLQYNSGTLQVFDMAPARRFMLEPCSGDAWCSEGRVCDSAGSGLCVDAQGPYAGEPCGPLGERSASEQLLYPGRCQAVDPRRPPSGDSLLASAVEIGAFATDIIYRDRPPDAPIGDPGRLFFPVRGDATLHWADVSAEGEIECGQARNGGACDALHRAGDDPDRENSRDLRLEPEPFALDATPDGRAIVVTHQTGQTVSVFDNEPWSNFGPRLVDTLPQLGRRPVGVAALPTPAVVRARGDAYFPGFLITFRAEPFVSLVRYVPDDGAVPARPVLASAGRSSILVNSVGTDSRGITVDDRRRSAAENTCIRELGVDEACAVDSVCVASLDAGLQSRLITCLEGAAAFGLGVYVANRSPESLLIGRTTPAVNFASTTDLPSFNQALRLSFGPARVVVGDVIVGGDRERPIYESRVFVVCFDSRRVVVYDPDKRDVELEITTGRGPHAIAVDSENGLLFLGHFTDSYVGVVSLDRRFPRTYGKFVATIGNPSPPRASK